jgi:hypothetical protein
LTRNERHLPLNYFIGDEPERKFGLIIAYSTVKSLRKNKLSATKKSGDTFFIKDGNLYINLETTGKYYKYLKKTTRRVLSYQEL